jgi:hypothetical protein
MVRRMLLADAGTSVTHFRASSAQQLHRGRQAAHPPARKRAKISAIVAQSDAEILKFLMAAAFHADHVIGATVANLGARGTGFNAVLQV